ncbi:MAG: hypothetical protein ACTHM0_01515 [Sphingomonas sp.]
MTGWSVSRAAIAAALVSVAAVPALAQDDWAPPRQQSDNGWQQSAQDQQDPQAYDDSAPEDDYSAPAQTDQRYGQDDSGDQSNGDDSGQTGSSGGFASRDAAPPDTTSTIPAPDNEDKGWKTWRSDPQPSGDTDAAGDDQPGSANDEQPYDNQLDANPQQAPGTINSFDQPEATPGFQASTGIDNRNQAVSACLAAVRARVGGGAGAARVDGIRGEWMVSGAVADGRAFYCSIHNGAIGDIEFGS